MRLHALAFVVALQAAVPPQETLVVERGRAGSVAIGATADSVYSESRVQGRSGWTRGRDLLRTGRGTSNSASSLILRGRCRSGRFAIPHGFLPAFASPICS